MIQKQLLEALVFYQSKLNDFALGVVYIVVMLLMVTSQREGIVEWNQEVKFLFQFLQNLEQLFSMSLSNSSGLQYFYISLPNEIYPEFKANFFWQWYFASQAARKERHLKAVHGSNKTAERIVKNYLKAKALETVTGRKRYSNPLSTSLDFCSVVSFFHGDNLQLFHSICFAMPPTIKLALHTSFK